MQLIIPYLIFDGNCEEAMNYYKDLFKGEITKIQNFKESPLDNPESADLRIFDSEMRSDNLIIKASDSFPGNSLGTGKNITLFLPLDEKEDQEYIYEALATEGEVQFPLSEPGGFAMVTDKFGIPWMLAYERNNE